MISRYPKPIAAFPIDFDDLVIGEYYGGVSVLGIVKIREYHGPPPKTPESDAVDYYIVERPERQKTFKIFRYDGCFRTIDDEERKWYLLRTIK